MPVLRLRFFVAALLAAVACAALLRHEASAQELREGEEDSYPVKKYKKNKYYKKDDKVQHKPTMCNALRSGCSLLAFPCCAACVCTDDTYKECTTVRTTCKGKWKSVASMVFSGKARCDYMFAFDAVKYPVYYDEVKAQSLYWFTSSSRGKCAQTDKPLNDPKVGKDLENQSEDESPKQKNANPTTFNVVINTNNNNNNGDNNDNNNKNNNKQQTQTQKQNTGQGTAAGFNPTIQND
jgi:hypothetical protein